ncbi:MAG: potassium transporter [Firmicutes bacterium HGW-Firmicutes-13]|nr:MAG: potassium transporter [Firmicutes bacterium HGW-Firmicutes-13]
MRLSVVTHMLGNLLILIGLFKILPLIWCLYYLEKDALTFTACIIITVTAGFLFRRIGKFQKDITLNESFVFVTFGWILAVIFGSMPFYFSGVVTSYVDAFFEAMSGFTTTGATVIDDVEALGYGILFWRSLTQWLGGMGIITLFVAVFPRLDSGGMFLLNAEIPGPIKERIVPQIARTAKILWLIYVFLSLLQVFLLRISGLSLFDSLTLTFATMATGGFSTRNESMASFHNPVAEVITIVFMIMAGVNFGHYYNLLRGNIKTLLKDHEFCFYLVFLTVVSLIVSFNLFFFTYNSFTESIRHGFFQVVSIITTTGFTTADFDGWHPLLRGMLFFLKFTGGCGGSTAGSIKQIRILVALKCCYREIYRLLHPKAVLKVKLGDKTVSEGMVISIMGFILLYVLIFTMSSLLMTSLGIDLVSSFSAVAATLGNIGPGLVLVGPLQTYSPIPSAGKILLSFLMLIGRLEIYTVLVLFVCMMPGTLLPLFRFNSK